MDVFGPDYVPSQLDIVRGLADEIEAQLGYPVIEPGDLVPSPEGWTEDFLREEVCRDYREPGEILAVHLAETREGHLGGGAQNSIDRCGIVMYWVGEGLPEDPYDAGCPLKARGKWKVLERSRSRTPG